MRVAIIGGGASGLFCASLLSEDIQVDLYEKNDTLGKKLLITGNGRCNVTNLKKPQTFLENVTTGSKFLTSAISGFSPKDMVDLLSQQQIELIEEEDNKIFPATAKAKTILNFLTNTIKSNVRLKTNITIQKINFSDEQYQVFYDDKSEVYDAVMIATGGKTYPGTGSTGDGYGFAKNLGHNIVQPRQSLCGLIIKNKLINECTGISFEVKASILSEQNKLLCSEKGTVLFTHFGVSGPAIHRLSSKFYDQSIKGYLLALDFMPNLSQESLLEQINIFAEENPKKEIFAFLEGLLIKRFAEKLKEEHPALFSCKCSALAKQKRVLIAELLKNFKTQIDDFDIYERAIITRGGVDTTEINPKSMESKLHKNLYFLGEVLNVDALTGGYNLQIAFSTAYACAKFINNGII